MPFSFFPVFNIFRHQVKQCTSLVATSRYLAGQAKKPTFGLLIDIDGVLVQGNIVIPKVVDAFRKLRNSNGEFILPTLFVTNSGNMLTREKAQQLSEWLGMEVHQDYVVCAHDPFKAYTDYHDKNVLVTGQGRAAEMAREIGFKKVITLDDLLKVFPMLDATDLTRRLSLPIPEDVEFTPVEAVVLFGEPVRWETFMQLLMDILLTNGDPRKVRLDYPYPHLPLLACNMDLQWRFTAQIPRFGHGVFLLCLESVYKKITEKDLQYQVMVGKPSVATYKYALKLIVEQAQKLGVKENVTSLYMIGDNINTDILGANLYNDHLTRGEKDIHYDPSVDVQSSVRNCYSVLVKTGVSSEELFDRQINHVPRDFLGYDVAHRKPTHIVQDFSDAIDLIFELEKFD